MRGFARFSTGLWRRLSLAKQLAILRHAKSDWGQPGLDDFDRPLNERGRGAAERVRTAIEEQGWSFDAIVASPSARTRETIERVGLADGARFDEALYLASGDTLLTIVRGLPDEAESALIVGHNPGLQDLVLSLARPDAEGLRRRVIGKYPTAALALLHLDCGSWSDAEPGCATIAELLLPRELD